MRPGEHGSLVSVLADVLDATDLTVAVRLGRWQDPRTLVLRVFGPSGETLAFAKLGLNCLGRASVTAEEAGLATAARLAVRGIEVPAVLHRASWESYELLVTSPLVASSTTGCDRGVPLQLMHELAHAGRSRVADPTSSGWWASVCERTSRVVDPALRGRLETVLRRLGARVHSDDVRMPLGWWHGDWTPWNMAWSGHRLLLWDWEHVAGDVPIGFDPLHYAAQRLRVTTGTRPDVERQWLQEVDDLLGCWLNLDRLQRRALVVAYLLEVNLRFVLDRQAAPERGRARQGWGLELLASEANGL